jgi:hypothetical protein
VSAYAVTTTTTTTTTKTTMTVTVMSVMTTTTMPLPHRCCCHPANARVVVAVPPFLLLGASPSRLPDGWLVGWMVGLVRFSSSPRFVFFPSFVVVVVVAVVVAPTIRGHLTLRAT